MVTAIMTAKLSIAHGSSLIAIESSGDLGPNTGGMGAYAPAPLLNASLRHQCMGIVQATVTAMAEEGNPYQGVLYAGMYSHSSMCTSRYNRA